jgi:hypothetical protein
MVALQRALSFAGSPSNAPGPEVAGKADDKDAYFSFSAGDPQGFPKAVPVARGLDSFETPCALDFAFIGSLHALSG